MTRRSLTEIAQAMRDAYRPDQAATITLQPGDHEAIAKLVDLVEWAKADPVARAAFNGWRAKRKGTRDG